MYYCTVEGDFSSAHFLRNYGGKCENLHGHNYRVIASVKGERLDDCGMLIDFKILKKQLGDIMESLDHKLLNELAPFSVNNPSAENIAAYVFHTLKDKLPCSGNGVTVHEVTVYESPLSRCTYRE